MAICDCLFINYPDDSDIKYFNTKQQKYYYGKVNV